MKGVINWIVDWEELQTELSYQKIAPVVTYQDIAVSILIDITSKNRYPADSINFAEIFAASLEKNIIDGITLSDSVVKYVIKDYFGDTVSLADVLSTANEFLKDIFDEVQARDLEFPARLPSALLNEGLLNSEFLLNGSGSSITDQIAVTSPIKTDLATMSDILTVAASPVKTDVTTISDVLTAVTNKLFSDTANISDVATNNISKYLTSGLSLDDFANINKSVNGVKGNIAVIGDTISVLLILSRLLRTRLLNEITLN